MNSVIQWIAAELCDSALTLEDREHGSEAERERLYRLSKAHDLAHVVGNGLFRHGALPDTSAWTPKFKKQMMLAMFRYEQLQATLAELCEALEEAEIPFVPLKGSVLRQYYPQPWMRTSCDIDILIHEEDLARAGEWLQTHLSYRKEDVSSHDMSLFSPAEVHLELHYDLVEERFAKESRAILRDVWQRVTPKEGYRYWHEMTDEMFYFYHVAHMAKHFEMGGCGIRAFLDIWVLDHRVAHEDGVRDDLLAQGGLATFAQASRALSEYWFSGREPDQLTLQMEQYVLSGGVYGTQVNQVSVQQGRQGGKIAYAMSRIFLKYDALRFHYPILQRHKWLFPLMQVRRWGKLIFLGGMKRSVRELKTNQTITKDAADQMKDFIHRVGL